MLVIEIKEPIDYEKVIDHNDNTIILKELSKNGNANAICKLGIMWYNRKFEKVGELKRSKKMQMMVAEYLFNYIPECGEANYYLYKLCEGNIFQHLEYLQKSVNLNFELAKKELANCHRHGLWGFEINEEKVYEIISPYIDDKIEEKFEEVIFELYDKIGKKNIERFSFITTEKLVEQNLEEKWCTGMLNSNNQISNEFLEIHFKLFYDKQVEKDRKEKELNRGDDDINYEQTVKDYDITVKNIRYDKHFFYRISSDPNITFKLFEKYCTKGWDFNQLRKHPNFPVEFFIQKSTTQYAGSYGRVGLPYDHPDLTPFLVKKYSEKKWEIGRLVKNKNFPLSFFENDLDKKSSFSKLFGNMSSRKDVTLEFIDKYNEKGWNWMSIAQQERISLPFLEKYIDKYNLFEGLSIRKDITPEFVKKYEKEKWNYSSLARNENFPLSFFEDKLDTRFIASGLGYNSNLTLEFIDKHIELRWEWAILDRKFNATQEFVEENKDMICVWKMLSYSDHVDIEFIKKYIKKPWEWLPLSKNLTLDFILEYPDKNYNLYSIFVPEKVVELKKKIKQDMIDNYLE